MSVVPFPSPMSPDHLVPHADRAPRRVAAAGATASPLSWPALWLRRWRGRRALAALDLTQIRDADLDPFEVRREAMKPFWRA